VKSTLKSVDFRQSYWEK